MEGKNHVSSGLLQRKCMCKNKVKEESDESPTPIATNGRKTISNKQKVVAGSKSSSSADNDYQCSSCPRQFSCQQALAGHRNIHRGEWEPHLDESDHDKVDQCPKVQIKTEASPVSNPYPIVSLPKVSIKMEASPLSNPNPIASLPKVSIKTVASPLSNPDLIAARKGPSSRNSGSMHKDASSSTDKPLVCAPKYPLSKPTNVQEGAATSAPLSHVAKPTNTLKGPSPRYPFVKPTNNHKVPSPRPSLGSPSYTLKRPSPLYHLVNSTNTLKASPTNTMKGPSPKCYLPYPSDTLMKSLNQYHLANPANTFKGSSSSSLPVLFPNATNNLLRPSLIAPKPPHMPSLLDPNRPLNNYANPIGKLATALGVRYESTIHKPRQCRRVGQSDMVLRTGSSLFEKKQMMGGNTRRFCNNSSNADSRSLLTAAGSDSTSRTEGGGNSKIHDLSSSSSSSSSSSQPKGGKGIEAHDLFPVTTSHEIHHHDNAQSSQGLAPEPDHNGEDVDLDLKL